jgi:hypothetical protein
MPTVPTEFGMVASALHAHGWRPIPLHPDTKTPAEGGWHHRNTTPWDAQELRLAALRHHHDACGIAIPDTQCAIDIDVTEESAAARLRALADEHLGQTPLVRTGMPPKVVLLLRSDGSIGSTKPHPIEVYAGSGQCAVFGWHQKAGKPYTWGDATPLDLAADDPAIPLVTATEVAAFLEAAEPVLTNLRRAHRAAGGCSIGKDASHELGAMLRAGVPFRRAARMVLEGAGEGGRHFAVRAVVSHGYNRGLDGDEILRVIERGAPEALLVHVGSYTERCLDDFRPQGGRW